MTISLLHLFVSGISSEADTTLVRPVNWNQEHVLEMATARILGRTTAATGAVEELTSAQVRSFAPMKGQIHGLTLSNDAGDLTNDIGIAIGEAASDETSPQLMILGTALIKQLNAGWAAGTNQGMRNSAIAIADTTYHVYLASKANGADVDVYAHTSAVVATVLTALQAETGGSAYTSLRRIGSILRSGGALRLFTQQGDKFALAVPAVDIDGGTSAGASAVTRTLASVPTGIVVEPALFVIIDITATTERVYLSALTATDASVDGSNAQCGSGTSTTGQFIGHITGVFTNTSAQIRSRQETGSAAAQMRIKTHGWADTRGR